MRKLFDHIKPLIGSLAAFAKKRMGFHHPPRLFLKQDSKNSNKALGRTAFYDPQQEAVTLYITARHPKDILRSLAHELIHHTQNLRGDLSPEKIGQMSKNYAQDNDHMRNMEKEAYLQGNMCFRDWEDTIEDKDKILIKLAESKFLKENKTMTTKINKETLEAMIREILLEDNTLDIKAGADYGKDGKLGRQMANALMAGDKAEIARLQGLIDARNAQNVKKEEVNVDIEKPELEEGEIEEKKKKSTTKLTGGDGADDAGTQYEAQIPEQEEENTSMLDAEKTLYERRFGNRNKKLFEHLIKNWAK